MYNAKERAVYNQDRERACKRLGITKNQYNWLRRKGNEYHSACEENCNGTYTEQQYEVRTKCLENEIYHYLIIQKLNTKEHKLYIYFQTDPRGATIYLDTVKIPENNYTQAVCIY